jgi:hypothetical protein
MKRVRAFTGAAVLIRDARSARPVQRRAQTSLHSPARTAAGSVMNTESMTMDLWGAPGICAVAPMREQSLALGPVASPFRNSPGSVQKRAERTCPVFQAVDFGHCSVAAESPS